MPVALRSLVLSVPLTVPPGFAVNTPASWKKMLLPSSDPEAPNTKLEPMTEAELNCPVLLPWPSATPPTPQHPRNASLVSTSWIRLESTI